MTKPCPKCRCTPCVCREPSAAWLRENIASVGGRGLRKQPGEMNKTESRYADRLRLQLAAGVILWWKFGAMTFKIGPDCRFTPDFAVMLKDFTVEFIDTKGMKRNKAGKAKAYSEDDAKVKIAAASEQFPFVFKRAFEADGEWKHELI